MPEYNNNLVIISFDKQRICVSNSFIGPCTYRLFLFCFTFDKTKKENQTVTYRFSFFILSNQNQKRKNNITYRFFLYNQTKHEIRFFKKMILRFS